MVNQFFTSIKLLMPIFGLLFITALSGHCQNSQNATQVYLEITPQSGTLNDTFILSVVINNPDSSDIPINLIDGDDFDLSFVGSQSKTTIVNSLHSNQLVYNYRLVPKRSGKLKTPGAEVRIASKVELLTPLTVEIGKGQKLPTSKNQDIMVLQRTNKKDVYLGEQLKLSLEVLTSRQLHDARFGDLSFEGFWVEEVDKNQHGRRIIDGRQYNTVLLNRILFPLATGPQTLSKKELFVKVEKITPRASNRFDPFDPWNDNLFDRFFGQVELQELTIRSNPVSINVKELPALPGDFPDWGNSTVLVGKTSIQLDYNKSTIDVGDSKTVEIKVSTYGNVRPLRNVPLNTPNSLRFYQERPEINMVELPDGLLSTSTWRISTVPLQPGLMQIPAIRLGFFEPESGQYQITTTEAITFSAKGEPQAAKDDSTANSATTEQLKKPESSTPAPYKEETRLEQLSKQLSLSLVLLIIFTLSFLTFLSSKMIQTARRIKAQRAMSEAIDKSEDIHRITAALRQFLTKKLKITEANPNNEQLKAAASNRITDSNLRFAILTILDELDLILYGGTKATPTEVKELKERILQLTKGWKASSNY